MPADARILVGDVRERLAEIPAGSVRCSVTSPPYWGLRDYGRDGQIGLEQTPEEYVAELVEVFREVRRVLADDGTLWLNLGDSYASNGETTHNQGSNGTLGHKHAPTMIHKAAGMVIGKRDHGLKQKDLVGIPWRVAFALQADGWYLRQDIIWHKPNPMPESVTDRCTKAHEYVFLLSKSPRYYYDNVAVKEDATYKGRGTQNVGAKNKLMPGQLGGQSGLSYAKARNPEEGRNRRSIWTITTKPFKGAHFAVMPEALVEPCVLAGSAAGDTVLDPFSGSGTVGVVALRHGRKYVGCELNAEYAALSERRIADDQPLMNSVEVSHVG